MKKILLLSFLFACFSTKAQTVFQSTPENDTLQKSITRNAEFPGGEEAWNKFLSDSIDLNIAAKKGAPAGTYHVFVEFNVTKKGKVTQVQARTTYGHGMEAEVIRVIKMSPDWLPAIVDNRKVSSIRTQAVLFTVDKTK